MYDDVMCVDEKVTELFSFQDAKAFRGCAGQSTSRSTQGHNTLFPLKNRLNEHFWFLIFTLFCKVQNVSKKQFLFAPNKIISSLFFLLALVVDNNHCAVL